jgi:hypothetical protein
MTSPATNRQFLLELARATLETLQSEPSPLESVTMCRSEPRFSDLAEPAHVEGKCGFHFGSAATLASPGVFTTSLSGVMLKGFARL